MLRDMDEILNSCIGGFHIYRLGRHFGVSYASQSFSDMLGYSVNELTDTDGGLYLSLIFPSDEKMFFDFVKKLSSGEKSLSAEYRLIKKDGSLIYVRDAVSVRRSDSGELEGYSILTDITDIRNENKNLSFLNDTMPCGFMKYTCDKQPKITYINKQMTEILRFPQVKDGEMDYLDIYRDNIFLMIPIEERRRFSLYLNRVYSVGAPVAGEITVLRCDGTKAYLFGWVTKHRNENGEEEFQSACLDITERHNINKEHEIKRYIKALSDVYDEIFQFDYSENTVKCIHATENAGGSSELFKWLINMPMQMEEAVEKWVIGRVSENDADRLREFFSDFSRNRRFLDSDSKPPLITYQAVYAGGEAHTYQGIFLRINSSLFLFCCRMLYEESIQTSQSANIISEAASLPQKKNEKEKTEVRIRTFGYFDIFVNGRPIPFRSQKSKELFALLVDRRGGYVSSDEAISFLWEDEPVNPVTLARYRKVALRLKNILEEYGISDVMESVDGKRRIVVEKVNCDLYDYLSGKEEYSQLFKGSYLTNYSWGETTLAELSGRYYTDVV